jgi:hypothetical protein
MCFNKMNKHKTLQQLWMLHPFQVPKTCLPKFTDTKSESKSQQIPKSCSIQTMPSDHQAIKLTLIKRLTVRHHVTAHLINNLWIKFKSCRSQLVGFN